MAVENKWAVDERNTSYPQAAIQKEGQHTDTVISVVAVAADDADDSVYGMAALPGTAVVKDINIACSAITGGTDFDIGLYRMNADGTIGAVIDKDMFLDGQSLAVAKARGAEITGMTALALGSSDKTVAELAALVSGLTEKDARYCLALTGNTVGAAAGTAVAIIEFANA